MQSWLKLMMKIWFIMNKNIKDGDGTISAVIVLNFVFYLGSLWGSAHTLVIYCPLSVRRKHINKWSSAFGAVHGIFCTQSEDKSDIEEEAGAHTLIFCQKLHLNFISLSNKLRWYSRSTRSLLRQLQYTPRQGLVSPIDCICFTPRTKHWVTTRVLLKPLH